MMLGHYFFRNLFSNSLINADWPELIFVFATVILNHSALSISGNDLILPDPGGHSISKLLLFIVAGSKLPSRAHAKTIFPLFCFIGFN